MTFRLTLRAHGEAAPLLMLSDGDAHEDITLHAPHLIVRLIFHILVADGCGLRGTKRKTVCTALRDPRY